MSTSKTAGSRSRGSAARAEGAKSRTITFQGARFKVPTKAPFALVRYMNDGNVDIPKVLEVLLGEEQAEKVWDMGLDMEEGAEFVEKLIEPYGISSGE